MHPANNPKRRFTYNDPTYVTAALALRESRQAYFDDPCDYSTEAYEAALVKVRAEEDLILAARAVVPASAVPVRFTPRGVQ